MKSIEVTQLSELQKNGDVELIDVRMPSEFRSVHAAGARNVPLDSLDPSSVFADRNGSKDQPLYVICQGGNRSTKACKKFVDAGFENIVNVEGGTTAWDKAGLPVVRGKQTLPLMQQVQLAAGSLVLLGAVLGYFVHPYFIGLSAFVGAGLMFAGATGTCGMAALLGKMPWNQCATGGGSCSV